MLNTSLKTNKPPLTSLFLQKLVQTCCLSSSPFIFSTTHANRVLVSTSALQWRSQKSSMVDSLPEPMLSYLPPTFLTSQPCISFLTLYLEPFLLQASLLLFLLDFLLLTGCFLFPSWSLPFSLTPECCTTPFQPLKREHTGIKTGEARKEDWLQILQGRSSVRWRDLFMKRAQNVPSSI